MVPTPNPPQQLTALFLWGKFQGKLEVFGLNLLGTPAACKVPRVAFLHRPGQVWGGPVVLRCSLRGQNMPGGILDYSQAMLRVEMG